MGRETFNEICELRKSIFTINKEYGQKYIYGLLIEEMAELSAELMKIVNGKNFDKKAAVEELADVEITIWQAKQVLVGYNIMEFDEIKRDKLRRTAERLGL